MVRATLRATLTRLRTALPGSSSPTQRTQDDPCEIISSDSSFSSTRSDVAAARDDSSRFGSKVLGLVQRLKFWKVCAVTTVVSSL